MDFVMNDYSSESDECEEEPPNPRTFDEWVQVHYDELVGMYTAFKENGTIIFGGAFFQFGDLGTFAYFVYTYMQP
jgi:hypothetical protein